MSLLENAGLEAVPIVGDFSNPWHCTLGSAKRRFFYGPGAVRILSSFPSPSSASIGSDLLPRSLFPTCCTPSGHATLFDEDRRQMFGNTC